MVKRVGEKRSGPIPDRMWEVIHECMPIVCIDLAITYEDRVLLVKRKQEPMAGEWWFVGGRLLKGEDDFSLAALRIADSEVGLGISTVGQLGTFNRVWKTDPFGHGRGTHSVSHVIHCHAETHAVYPDENHSGFRWWNPYKSEIGFKADPTVKYFSRVALLGRHIGDIGDIGGESGKKTARKSRHR